MAGARRRNTDEAKGSREQSQGAGAEREVEKRTERRRRSKVVDRRRRRRLSQSIASLLLALSHVPSLFPSARPLSTSQGPRGRERSIGIGRVFGTKKGGEHREQPPHSKNREQQEQPPRREIAPLPAADRDRSRGFAPLDRAAWSSFSTSWRVLDTYPTSCFSLE